jgi:hypothetical protein
MAVEQLFAHFKDQKSQPNATYDPNEPESYEAYLFSMMDDAGDYEYSILAGDRSEAQLYYYGYEPSIDYTDVAGPYIGEDPNQTLGELLDKDKKNRPNRSTYVSTDVKDAILLMLPGLIRLFGASEHPVNLIPRSEPDSDMAEQATNYVNYVIWNDNPGFVTLYGAIKDALTVRTGFIKWWSEDQKEFKRKRFTNITVEQLQMILAEDPTAKVVDLGKPVQQHAPTIPPNLAGTASGPPPMGAPPQPPGPPPMAAPGQPPAVPNAGPPSGPPGGPPPGAPPPPPGVQPGGAAAGPGSPNAGNAPAGQPMGPPPGPLAGAPMPAMPPAPPPPPPVTLSHAVIQFEVSKPLIKICGVPPEEMRLDRYARSFSTSRIVGHERIVPADELIAMGYDRELVEDNIQSSESTFTVEPQLRNPGRFMGTRMGDGCKYGEWYVKIDKDGDGIPELRYICTIGQDRQIVSDEEANRVKIAMFSCDPVSHTIVGESITDYVKDVQRIKTNLMRAILDSAAESINPKTVINELLVNPDDAMNDDLGAVIRTRGDPGSTVMFTNTPFLGQQVTPVIDTLNDQLARRTGLTDAAKGLDPKALQSSTMIGVEAVINGAQERVELTARVLCETGFKTLFEGLFNEVCENPNQQRTLKINGKWVPYDTGTFDASMGVEVNANLGKGSDMVRMLALQMVDQRQQLIVQTYGLNNPVCGIPEMLNTQTDLMELANIKNIGRYFKTPSPQMMQQVLAQPKTPDPMALAAQAQLEKVRSDTAKAVGQQQLDREKMVHENVFKHQQLQAKTAFDFQKLGLESQKAGVDNHVQLAQLAGSLMKNQQDSDAADQDSQMKSAEQQNQQDQVAQAGKQADSEAALKAATIASQHMQKMAQINSSHSQAMTDLASRHHAAMTGHNLAGAKLVAGALSQDADQDHEAQQNDLDRQHDEMTTAATLSQNAAMNQAKLGAQQKIAKMRPARGR